ncbi:hypothetical protein ASPVEDRAFT_732834 [Aspergillus versicolor CBS 583.65]|uniref:Uncharacterized protein n=1 Tax=Aspergillus versicolor CBS 583.65 TaxID=1036611 RepID=A0A1L9PPI3_ASPVE|nr:uncharacterized protein ASPVEDRAFT_732834 [Aspergillus versicolor CBS 583.65]OJJ03438.1 hypothetical protein ASPVEDRAFT_732834 [Aspergillus versicolor CBS 583.65]
MIADPAVFFPATWRTRRIVVAPVRNALTPLTCVAIGAITGALVPREPAMIPVNRTIAFIHSPSAWLMAKEESLARVVSRKPQSI